MAISYSHRRWNSRTLLKVALFLADDCRDGQAAAIMLGIPKGDGYGGYDGSNALLIMKHREGNTWFSFVMTDLDRVTKEIVYGNPDIESRNFDDDRDDKMRKFFAKPENKDIPYDPPGSNFNPIIFRIRKDTLNWSKDPQSGRLVVETASKKHGGMDGQDGAQ